MAVTQAGIDAYLKVKFAGNKAKTKKKTIHGKKLLGSDINEQLWMPVTVPTMTNKIEVSVKSWRHTLLWLPHAQLWAHLVLRLPCPLSLLGECSCGTRTLALAPTTVWAPSSFASTM